MTNLTATKSYKFRLYPTKEQQRLIDMTIGHCRFVYNYSLGKQLEQDRYYKRVEEMVQQGYFPRNNWKGRLFNKYEAIKALPELKKHYPFLKEVDAIALQDAIERLGRAFERRYKKLGGRPHFKSKHHRVQSYTTKKVADNIRIEGNRIRLPKLGLVKMAKSREVIGEIKTATVKRTATEKYFVSITCKTEAMPLPRVEKKIGLDMGLKDFAITSDGEKIKNPKCFSRSEKRLAFLQKSLSRKQTGSSNYHKAKLKVARQHERIRNQRNDFLHKLSSRLISENQVIAIEDLSIQEMLCLWRKESTCQETVVEGVGLSSLQNRT